MTMIERVARAIMRDDFEGDDMWGSADREVRDSYMKNARAAIKAMRELTDGVLGIVRTNGGLQARAFAVVAWPDMIDAALAEEV